MKRLALVPLAVLALSLQAFAQAKPSADALLKAAQAQAKKEGKLVFVHFTASWCGWCKHLEAFLDEKEVKPIMAKAFVFVTLDVLEQPDKKSLENPGAIDVLKGLKAESEGIPFTVFYDASGKVVTTSRATDKPGSNIGYPAAPEEIAHFLKMLESTKKVTPADRETLKKILEVRAAKLRQ